MSLNLYSKNNKKKIQFFCIAAIFLLLLSNCFELVKLFSDDITVNSYICISGIIINSVSCIIFSLLIIVPARFGLLAIVSITYGLWLLYVDSSGVIPVFLFYLSYVILRLRGFYIRNKLFKIIITVLFLIFILIIPIKQGIRIYVQILLQDFIFIFCLMLETFLLNITSGNSGEEKILRLSSFDGITHRDYEWLKMILNNEKYAAIAVEYHLSEGSIKNRLKVIYDILEVGDKTGFINKYHNYTILY